MFIEGSKTKKGKTNRQRNRRKYQSKKRESMFDSRQDRSSCEHCIDGIKIREAMEFNYLDSVERDNGICDTKL